MLSFKMES